MSDFGVPPKDAKNAFLMFSKVKCLQVTDYKKFDTDNVLPMSMDHFSHILKIMNFRQFSEG